MALQSKSRLVAMVVIFLQNPLSASKFAFDQARGRTGPARRLRFGKLDLLVRPNSPDLRVVRSCLLGEFDEVMNKAKNNFGFILDLGGYIGLVSILFAIRFPASKIICLEPSAENFALARRNCAPYPNIEVINAAVAPASGTLTLHDRGTGQWGFTVVEHSADKPTSRIEEVEAVTVEQLLAKFGKTGIDLVKLDIEGGEYALLKDCPEWVLRTDVIVAEIHDRICPGASAAFEHATAGRLEVSIDGEKRMSISSATLS